MFFDRFDEDIDKIIVLIADDPWIVSSPGRRALSKWGFFVPTSSMIGRTFAG